MHTYKLIPVLALIIAVNVYAVGADSSNKITCTTFGKSSAKQLCLRNSFSESDAEQTWFVKKPGTPKRILPKFQSAFMQVVNFEISHNRQWLAVLSVGEGHPIVEIFSLRKVLQGDSVEPRIVLNPYPGWINIEQWRNNTLEISTDRNLPANLTNASKNLTFSESTVGTSCYLIKVASLNSLRIKCVTLKN